MHIAERSLLLLGSCTNHSLRFLYTHDLCKQHLCHWPEECQKTHHRIPQPGARRPRPTFEEAVLAVHADNPLAQQAGCTAKLTVVPVEPPIGATHRHVAGPADLHTVARGLPCRPVKQAPAPVAAEFLPAGG